MLDDTQQKGGVVTEPSVAAAEPAAAQVPAVVAPQPAAIDADPVVCNLKVGEPDERGNTVKYIYSCDQDYVVYYSHLEHRPGVGDATYAPRSGWRSALRLFSTQGSAAELPYECEGVQAQLSSDPAKRKAQRLLLLPLGTERAKLQALLRGWKRRQSYDSSIATALQLALSGEGKPEANQNALQTLQDAKASILTEREIAGRAQYARYTLLLGVAALLLLFAAQHNLFKDSPNFWLGAQTGVIGAILSIAIGIRNRVVLPDIGFAGNMSDSALRLTIGAVSGGALVLLFSCGLLPTLQTSQGVQDGVHSTAFILLLGIIAGFVEQLVPSLLDDQARHMQNGDGAKAPAASASASGSSVAPTAPAVTG